jgi:hypothetical protein
LEPPPIPELLNYRLHAPGLNGVLSGYVASPPWFPEERLNM